MTNNRVRSPRLAHKVSPSIGAGLGIALLVSLCVTETLRAGETNTAALRVVRIDKPGLKNCFQVTPGLYRGAQPTAEGMRHLQALGIKTVISLRAFHSDEDEIGSLPLQRESIRFNTWHPEDEDVVRFLKIVTATNRGPVFVHCQFGSDRTGTMVAIYRMAVQGWSRDDTIKEMTGDGFGFHSAWKNLVKYLRELDVESLKRRAGILPSNKQEKPI